MQTECEVILEPTLNQCGNAASKAGLLGLTKTMALEHARNGITCNAILPGLIGTELLHMIPSEILNGAVPTIPSRCLGLMDEVASLVSFLISDKAADINGEEIHIDGGMRLNVQYSRKSKRNEKAIRQTSKGNGWKISSSVLRGKWP